MKLILIAMFSMLAPRPCPGTQPPTRIALIRCPQLSALHRAAAAGDVGRMEALVRAGARIDEDLACHGTPLRQAVHAGQREAVRWLVQHGARVEPVLDDAVEAGDLSILAFLLRAGRIDLGSHRDDLCARAAERGRSDILRWLLKQDPPSPQSALDAALRAAARSGRFEQADWLLSEGADPKGVDEHGRTALHDVAGARAADLTRLLLSAGARADAADERGAMPLHRAAMLGQDEVVALLLEAGAPPDAADREGERPLLKALSMTVGSGDRLEVVRQLLAAGADPNQRDGQRVSALMHAIETNQRQAMDLLLGAGAKVTQRAPVEFAPLWSPGQGLSGYRMLGAEIPKGSGRGWTALHAAAMIGREDMARPLLSRGAKIDFPSPTGKTPLWVAAAFGRAGMVGWLLARGADPKRRDEGGRTALHAAALAGSREEVRRLIVAGLETDARDRSGQTALHLACTPVTVRSWRRFGRGRTTRQEEMPARRAVIAELIAHRARLTATDAWGQTPLHLAAEAGLLATVEDLLQAGASTRAVDREGRTPLALADEEGHQQVVNTLSCWARRRDRSCLSNFIEERARAEAEAAARKAAADKARRAKADARARAAALIADAKDNGDGDAPGSANERGKPHWIEENRREQLRQHGQRVWALVVRKKETDARSLITATGERCSKSLGLRFDTPEGRLAVAELCHPFSDTDFKAIRLGARLEVVYLPDSLMRVGQDLVAAEIALARDVFP